MKKVKLTLKDVAEKLGVSTATISNAFNRPDQLSSKRREEILAACKNIGYHGPNKAAQILRKGQSNIIGLILADRLDYMVSDPVASTFIRGVSSELQNAGKHLLLYAGNANTVRDVTDFVDGFICYGAPQNPVIGEELASLEKPVVTVDFDLNHRASINIDNEQAAYEIARAAIQPGDKVAILGLRLIKAPNTCRIYDADLLDAKSAISHRRLDGYQRALGELGIEVTGDAIWHIPESGGNYSQQAAAEVLTSHPRPDVILCMSDLIALAVLQKAHQLGIRVPQDVRVTGFDGIDEALRCQPPLMTVCQSNEAKGRMAAEALLNNSKQSQTLAHELILGDSGSR